MNLSFKPTLFQLTEAYSAVLRSAAEVEERSAALVRLSQRSSPNQSAPADTTAAERSARAASHQAGAA
jgi:hypothetical protein